MSGETPEIDQLTSSIRGQHFNALKVSHEALLAAGDAGAKLNAGLDRKLVDQEVSPPADFILLSAYSVCSRLNGSGDHFKVRRDALKGVVSAIDDSITVNGQNITQINVG